MVNYMVWETERLGSAVFLEQHSQEGGGKGSLERTLLAIKVNVKPTEVDL